MVQPPNAFEALGRFVGGWYAVGPRAGAAPLRELGPGGLPVGKRPFGLGAEAFRDVFGRLTGFLRGRNGSAALGFRIN